MTIFDVFAGPVDFNDVPFSDSKYLLVPAFAIYSLLFSIFITYFVLLLARIMEKRYAFWTVYKYVYGTILILLTLLLIFG